jgi:hypothetical protein
VEAEKAQQWRVLCEQVALEKDPDKFMQLVNELDRLLEEKEHRFKQRCTVRNGS